MLVTLIIFLLAFGAVLALERVVHRTLQTIALVGSGHAEPATLLYAIPLFPGVALHELSHAVMAVLLGVKVRGFSLMPKRQTYGIRLGFVEILRTDPVRASLIGAAPLLFGTVALLLIGVNVFDAGTLVNAIATGNAAVFVRQLVATIQAPDSLPWFYLVFAIANSMMPSPSDTKAWPPVVGASVGALAVVLVALGYLGGTAVLEQVSRSGRYILEWLATAFAITAFINVLVIALLWLLSRLLQAMTGRRVEYRR